MTLRRLLASGRMGDDEGGAATGVEIGREVDGGGGCLEDDDTGTDGADGSLLEVDCS